MQKVILGNSPSQLFVTRQRRNTMKMSLLKVSICFVRIFNIKQKLIVVYRNYLAIKTLLLQSNKDYLLFDFLQKMCDQNFQQPHLLQYKQSQVSPIILEENFHPIHQMVQNRQLCKSESHQQLILGSSKFIVYLSNQQKQQRHRSVQKKVSTVRPNTSPFEFATQARNRNRNKLSNELKVQLNKKERKKQSSIKSKLSEGNMIKSTNRHTKKQTTIDYISLNKQNIAKISSANRSHSSAKPKIEQQNIKKSKEKFLGIQNKIDLSSKNQFLEPLPLQSPKLKEKSDSCKSKRKISSRNSEVRCEDQPIIKIEQKQSDRMNEEVPNEIKLNHDEIKKLFGDIHDFYQPNNDYLSVFVGKKDKSITFMQGSSLHKNLSQVNEQCRVQISPTNFQIKVTQNRSCYSFESDRALIVPYLKKIETKKLYLLMMRQNMKNPHERFRDEQFPPYYLNKKSNQNLAYISKQKVYWSYYPPEPSTTLFPQNKSQSLMKSVSTNKHKFSLISFFCCLLFSQEEIITRLFQPPINNVYCTWIFTGCQFQPVYIDGYFPLNENMEHFYGQTNQGLWLSVLIKCICKIKNSYEIEEINRLTGGQLYEMLTGLKIEPFKLQSYDTEENLLGKEIQHRLKRNFTCLLFNSDKQSYQLIKEVKAYSKLVVYDACFAYRQIINISDMLRSQVMSLFFIPDHENRFIYSSRFLHSEMTKFQIQCSKKTELYIICNQTEQSHPKMEKGIYIYECSYNKSKKKQIVLSLKSEGSLDKPYRCAFKRGVYKLFFEAGDKKIHQFFQTKENDMPFGDMVGSPKKEKQQEQQKQYILTILSDHEIKLSQCEGLSKKGSCVEDRKSMYYDPSQKASKEEQYD